MLLPTLPEHLKLLTGVKSANMFTEVDSARDTEGKSPKWEGLQLLTSLLHNLQSFFS
jgi:hypothetical protein